MSKLIYKEQTIAELEYNLLLSSGLSSNFKILKNSLIRWHGIDFDFSIIGASHFVKINGGSHLQMTELLACIDSEDLAVESILEKKRLADLNNYKYCKRFKQGFIYRFNAEIIKDKVKDQQEFVNKYRSKDYAAYLDYIFPSFNDLAITSIEIKKEDNELLWLTYHSYPQENIIIKTTSVLGRSEQ